MCQISIIIPVYNVEQYIDRCIQSVTSQTIKSIEIILVNDGSSDRCPEICDSYAKMDSRIKVIHQQNAGVSSARNSGLDIAAGDYVGFVDADDFVSSDMFEKLLYALVEHDAEVSCCDLAFVDQDDQVVSGASASTKVLTGEQIFAKMLDTNAFLRVGVWNKLYKRSTVKDVYFEVSRHMSEDLLFLIDTVLETKRVAYIQQPLYFYYRQREGAATKKSYGPYEKQRIESTKQLVEAVRYKHPAILNEAVLYKCINGDLTALNKMIEANVKDIDIIQLIKRELRYELTTIIKSRLAPLKKMQLLVAAASFTAYQLLYKFSIRQGA